GERLFEQRRTCPMDDVISLLVRAEPPGGPYTKRELDVNFVTIVVAGNETTRSAMTIGMLALAQNPDQYAQLRERPELIPQAGAGMTRGSAPVWHCGRPATRDVELRGQTIRKGDKVVLWFSAANRDPEVFPDPHRFDVTRPPSRNVHASFGRGGPHFCLGAHIAALEIRVPMEELVPRASAIRLAGQPRRVRSTSA